MPVEAVKSYNDANKTKERKKGSEKEDWWLRGTKEPGPFKVQYKRKLAALRQNRFGGHQ